MKTSDKVFVIIILLAISIGGYFTIQEYQKNNFPKVYEVQENQIKKLQETLKQPGNQYKNIERFFDNLPDELDGK